MRICCLQVVFLFVVSCCFGKSLVTVLPPGETNPVSFVEPAMLWTETLSSPRKVVVHFLKIDLTSPEVEVFAALSPDPDGPEGPAEGELVLPETFMSDEGILALINANAFSYLPPPTNTPPRKGMYVGRPVRIQGLAAADGEIRSPDQPDRLAFWLDEKGKPHIGHPTVKDKVQHGVADWFSPLVVDGLAVGETKPGDEGLLDEEDLANTKISKDIHPRTMLGFDDTGTWLLLVVVDGRRNGYSIGLRLSEQAALMKERGCTQAINLDGGGSSIIMIRDENGDLRTVNRPSSNRHRPIPIMLGLRRNPEH